MSENSKIEQNEIKTQLFDFCFFFPEKPNFWQKTYFLRKITIFRATLDENEEVKHVQRGLLFSSATGKNRVEKSKCFADDYPSEWEIWPNKIKVIRGATTKSA